MIYNRCKTKNRSNNRSKNKYIHKSQKKMRERNKKTRKYKKNKNNRKIYRKRKNVIMGGQNKLTIVEAFTKIKNDLAIDEYTTKSLKLPDSKLILEIFNTPCTHTDSELLDEFETINNVYFSNKKDVWQKELFPSDKVFPTIDGEQDFFVSLINEMNNKISLGDSYGYYKSLLNDKVPRITLVQFVSFINNLNKLCIDDVSYILLGMAEYLAPIALQWVSLIERLKDMCDDVTLLEITQTINVFISNMRQGAWDPIANQGIILDSMYGLYLDNKEFHPLGIRKGAIVVVLPEKIHDIETFELDLNKLVDIVTTKGQEKLCRVTLYEVKSLLAWIHKNRLLKESKVCISFLEIAPGMYGYIFFSNKLARTSIRAGL